MVDGKLRLSVGGTVLGPLVDEFSGSAPATMRLTIANLPDGGSITAEWQPWAGGAWVSFVADAVGCHYDFPVPGLGLTAQRRVVAHTPTGAASQTQFVMRASSEAG
jgi:hypothetical protein